MRKVLILTVGTGTRPDVDIVKPLIKTIKDSAPVLTVFIVSGVSKLHAERITEQLNLHSDQYEIVLLPDPDSLENVYGHINSAIRLLIQKGYVPDEITIDFTSGTKAMTSGAILAGVAWGCSGLKYITGKRKNGVVQDGTEKFITEQPNKILAHRKIELGRRMIEAFRFDAAIDLFSSINKALLEEWEIEILEGLINVGRAYDSWDRFMQNRVDEYLSKVPGD